MSFVHQDLGLVESLSVLENLRVADIARRRARASAISWRRERGGRGRRSSATACAIDPTALVARAASRSSARCSRSCGPSRRSAPSAAARALLVLDEPTVFLPREGVERLFSLVRDAAAAGASDPLRLARPRRGARDHRPRHRAARRRRRRHGHHRDDERDDVRRDDHRPPAGGAGGRRARRPRPSSRWRVSVRGPHAARASHDVSFDDARGRDRRPHRPARLRASRRSATCSTARRAARAGTPRPRRRAARPHARSRRPRHARRHRADPGRPEDRRQRRLPAGRREHGARRARPLLQRRSRSSAGACAARRAA